MRWELHIRKASDDLDVQMNEMLDMAADKTDYLILTDVNDQLTIAYITDRMIASVYSIKTYTLDCNALGEYTWRQSTYCNDGRWKYIDSILTYTGTSYSTDYLLEPWIYAVRNRWNSSIDINLITGDYYRLGLMNRYSDAITLYKIRVLQP